MNSNPYQIPFLPFPSHPHPVLGSTVYVMESVFLKCMAILRWKVGRNFCTRFLCVFFNLLDIKPQTRICMCLCVCFFSFDPPLFQSTPFYI